MVSLKEAKKNSYKISRDRHKRTRSFDLPSDKSEGKRKSSERRGSVSSVSSLTQMFKCIRSSFSFPDENDNDYLRLVVEEFLHFFPFLRIVCYFTSLTSFWLKKYSS